MVKLTALKSGDRDRGGDCHHLFEPSIAFLAGYDFSGLLGSQ